MADADRTESGSQSREAPVQKCKPESGHTGDEIGIGKLKLFTGSERLRKC